jgi:hypothetical protein
VIFSVQSLTFGKKDIETIDAILSKFIDGSVLADQRENITSESFGIGITSANETRIESDREQRVERSTYNGSTVATSQSHNAPSSSMII